MDDLKIIGIAFMTYLIIVVLGSLIFVNLEQTKQRIDFCKDRGFEFIESDLTNSYFYCIEDGYAKKYLLKCEGIKNINCTFVPILVMVD